MRGIIYARQSRYREESVSITVQIEDSTRTAGFLGIELVGEPLVDKVSGYKNRGRSRPEWQRLLKILKAGEADCVVVYKSDRLSRGGGPGWAPLFDAADAAGIDTDRLVATSSGFMSEAEIGFRATMDREESKKLAARMKDVRAKEAEAGRPAFGGPRPFGFLDDYVTHHPIEAEQLRDAARRILAGEALNSTARRIGIPLYRLKRVLRSERVAGTRLHGEKHGKTTTFKTYPATWEPILDADTWEAVRSVLDRRSKPHTEPGKVRARSMLLTGFLICGVPSEAGICGHPVGGCPVTSNRKNDGDGRRKGIRGYRCCWCMRVRRAADPLEAYVIDELLRRHPVEVTPTEVDPALPVAVHRLAAALDDLDDGYVASGLPVAVYGAQRAKLVEELDAARDALAEASEAAVPDNFFGAYLDGDGDVILPYGSGAEALSRAWWADADLRQKRAHVARHVERIVIHPARRGRLFDRDAVEIVWRASAAAKFEGVAGRRSVA